MRKKTKKQCLEWQFVYCFHGLQDMVSRSSNWVLMIVDDPRVDVAHLPAAQCRHWFYEQAGLHIPAKMLHLPIWFTMVPCFCRGGFTESTVVGKGNLLHITVPLGSKASLITVTIPPLMKYPSVSLAASWTLSTLIIYKINKSCENNLCQRKSVVMQCESQVQNYSDDQTLCSQVKNNQMQQRSVKRWW